MAGWLRARLAVGAEVASEGVLTDEHVGQEERIERRDAGCLVELECLENPMLPEVFVLEVDHASEALRVIVENEATDKLLF